MGRLKSVFWNRQKWNGNDQGSSSPCTIRESCGIFILCLANNYISRFFFFALITGMLDLWRADATPYHILIVAIDSCLHISTEAVQLYRILAELSMVNSYSMNLALWYLNTTAFYGSMKPRTFVAAISLSTINISSSSPYNWAMMTIIDSTPLNDYVLNYTDKENV
jgi:hypothetical protein